MREGIGGGRDAPSGGWGWGVGSASLFGGGVTTSSPPTANLVFRRMGADPTACRFTFTLLHTAPGLLLAAASGLVTGSAAAPSATGDAVLSGLPGLAALAGLAWIADGGGADAGVGGGEETNSRASVVPDSGVAAGEVAGASPLKSPGGVEAAALCPSAAPTASGVLSALLVAVEGPSSWWLLASPATPRPSPSLSSTFGSSMRAAMSCTVRTKAK